MNPSREPMSPAPGRGSSSQNQGVLRKPDWLKVSVRGGAELSAVRSVLDRYGLNTVCKEANCPNRMECFSQKTATFLILGSVCTRNCTFCNVTPGCPEAVDPDEPNHILKAVQELGLRYVVITSVTRDDLPDGGAGHFARVIRLLKETLPQVQVEVLIPDFQGDPDALRTVLEAGLDVLNHNIETVPRLYSSVRPQAVYERSLQLLKRAKEYQGNPPFRTKSGLMLGLGEEEEEVLTVLRDLRKVRCDSLTLGQYLAPSKNHHPVIEYISPERFAYYRDRARELGFSGVASGPFVRSSYHAAELHAAELDEASRA
ncbi:MAG TPA: lipoyl synthase [Spirochaetales bacterium]|nr:lipoyl synthase [Spirochaetales bacterium]